MRRFLNIVLIFILTADMHAQVLSSGLQFRPIDKNISELCSWEEIYSFYYDLDPVQDSRFQNHIRISITGQIIDLFLSDGKNYDGILTNIITQYDYEKRKGDDYERSVEKQKVFEKIFINKSLSDSVANALLTSGFFEIPTDSLIPNWCDRFMHCSGICIDSKINNKFKDQCYSCPWSQNDSIPFIKTIVDNYDLFVSVLKLDSLYNIFDDKLPKGKTYSKDGYRMIYKFTDEQIVWLKKTEPIRDYLKSLRDTIDNYITAMLDSQKIELNGIDCFEDYYLTFGENGKLKNVYVNDKPKLKDGLSYYLEDSREIRKCKRKINEIFKVVDFGFLNPRFEIERCLSFDLDGHFILRDNTIY